MSLLDHNVLVVDVGRDGPLLNGFNQPVGSVQQAGDETSNSASWTAHSR